jgi:hypothetical protein
MKREENKLKLAPLDEYVATIRYGITGDLFFFLLSFFWNLETLEF